MKYDISTTAPEGQRTGCLVLGVPGGRRELYAAAARADDKSGGWIRWLARESGDLPERIGSTALTHEVPGIRAERVLLVRCGQQERMSRREFRRVSRAAAAALQDIGGANIRNGLPLLEVEDADARWKACQTVLAAEEAGYRFDRFRRRPPAQRSGARRATRNMTLVVSGRGARRGAERGIREGGAVARGMSFAKDLANQPANICTPIYLAQQAGRLQKDFKNIKVKSLGLEALKRLGMNALLAVARGSHQPPRLILVEYEGAPDRRERPIVLVGKGVTFDTGGISLKPAAAMDEMKFDMCGAAGVLGTIAAAAELQLPLRVVGVVPATETMPGGNASRPGDIVASMSGQTVEILNTDAEGRLILCDALTYSERFRPDTVIDLATLTGACVIALGKHATGLLSNHNPLARELLAAGEAIEDRAWQLPLWDEYQEQLHSSFADMGNIGGREAGTITAACFLSRFAKKFRWAHLDIAGTAWLGGKEKKATGRPVPLLTQYLLARCS